MCSSGSGMRLSAPWEKVVKLFYIRGSEMPLCFHMLPECSLISVAAKCSRPVREVHDVFPGTSCGSLPCGSYDCYTFGTWRPFHYMSFDTSLVTLGNTK